MKYCYAYTQIKAMANQQMIIHIVYVSIRYTPFISIFVDDNLHLKMKNKCIKQNNQHTIIGNVLAHCCKH